jgi:hypothetical protein
VTANVPSVVHSNLTSKKATAKPRASEPPSSRTGWTTIAIPNDVVSEIQRRHIPRRARSVQAYVNEWVKAGNLIDQALESSTDPRHLITVLQSILLVIKPENNEE